MFHRSENRDFHRESRYRNRDWEWDENRYDERFEDRNALHHGSSQEDTRYYARRTRSEDLRSPGPYAGIGPAGFSRSDERILEEINDRLTMHGHIDARQMSVQVQEGEVTLTGAVNSKLEKRMAEELVDGVFGVKDVHNRLRVENTNRHRGAENSSFHGGQFQQGMNVGDRDGHFIGTVKEIHSREFLLDRPMARDLWVPMNTCNIAGGQVVLDIRSDEIDQQGWRTAELV